MPATSTATTAMANAWAVRVLMAASSTSSLQTARPGDGSQRRQTRARVTEVRRLRHWAVPGCRVSELGKAVHDVVAEGPDKGDRVAVQGHHVHLVDADTGEGAHLLDEGGGASRILPHRTV